jgi:PAS domain S-box-containing protein
MTDYQMLPAKFESLLANAAMQLEEKINELSLVRRVTDALARAMTVREGCEQLIEIILNEINCENCSILLLEGETYVLMAARGQSEEMFTSHNGGDGFSPGEGIAGQAAENQECICIDDVAKDIRFAARPEQLTTVVSLLCVPLVDRGACIGVLNLSAPETGIFGVEQERLVTIIANQAALFLTNIQMQEKLADSFENLKEEFAEREKAEQQIRKLSNVVEQIADAVLITDITGSIQYVNPAFECLTGYTANEMSGQTTNALCAESGDVYVDTPLWRRVLQGAIFRGTRQHRRKDGTIYQAEITVGPVKADNESVTHVVMTHKDITDRLRAEEATKITEKSAQMASIGIMAAGITHEINQPLNAIRVTTDSLLLWDKKHQEEIPEMVSGQLQLISDGVKRIDMVIQHMRTFWQIPLEGKQQSYVLDDVVREAMYLIDRQMNVQMVEPVTDLRAGNAKVLGSAIHTQQIIINLMVNAIHAFDEQSDGSNEIRVATFCQEDRIILEVSDNGTGLPDMPVEDLFDPFFSSRKPGAGMGLGLAIVKQFVEKQQGVIDIRSNKSGGATVTVSFPICKE